MLNLMSFDYDSQVVRTVMIDGDPWFVAVDVCRILDLTNPSMAIKTLDEDEVRSIDPKHCLGSSVAGGGAQMMNVVSESGLYALIFASRKAEAKAFRKWVTGTVLPSLRREGVFVMGQEAMDAPNPAPAFGFDMATKEAENWLSFLRELRFVAGPKVVREVWAKSPYGPLLHQQGFDPAAQNNAAQDVAVAFIGDVFEVTGAAQDVISAGELVAIYAQWRANQGHVAMQTTTMAKHLAAVSETYRCPRTGKRFTRRKSSTWFYVGLRLA